MVISDFNAKSVFLDTAPLIYFIEGHSVYQPILKQLFEANDKGSFTFITSAITLLEVLVKPLQAGRDDIVIQYQKILANAEGIEVFEINNSIAITAARLRANYNMKTPDALQMATAIEYGANYFLTNDSRLKNMKEISVIILADLR